MQLSDEDDDLLPLRMPILLRILAPLHLIGGGYLLVAIVRMVSGGVDLGAAARMAGTTSATIILSVVFLGVLGVTTGVGMYSGKAWGWWVAAFYYVYAILRAGNGMLFMIGFWDEIVAEGSRGPEEHLRKFAGRMAIHGLILVYLCSGPVIEYFGLQQLSRWRAIAKLVGIPVVLYFLASEIRLILS